ncbi:MAG: phosphoglycerate mutase, partial [Candidatus Omnitrophota bacterium]
EIAKITCMPPHDIIGQNIEENLPKGKHSSFLIDLMERSCELLKKHEINQVRVDLGENPANMIWLWGQGRKPQLPSFKEKFGLTGSVISAVDLIKGLGKILGLDVINVLGATGYYDTNYLGKAEAAVNALKNKEFVFVHVEATDEAGHNGDLRAKLSAIEKFDQLIVGTILNRFKKDPAVRILVLPDHATPITKRTHTNEPVCFTMYGNNISCGEFSCFSEEEAKKSKIYFDKGYELLNAFINSNL